MMVYSNNVLSRKDTMYNGFLLRGYPEIFTPIPGEKISKRIKCKTITFQVTSGCNLKCSYCYEINKKNIVMDFPTAKKFVDNLLDNQYSNYGIDTDTTPAIIFEFIGGEPFLAIDLIVEISDYIEQQLIEKKHPWLLFHRYSISSNGTLYFDEKVQNYIARYKDLLSLNITVDGNKRLHDACRLFPDGTGSYDIAHKAALDWKNKTGEAGSKITLAPGNIQYASEAIISYIEDGFTDIWANCVFEEGWNVEHAKVYYKELKKIADYMLDNDLASKVFISLLEFRNFRALNPETENENWCGGTGVMLALDPKGLLFPCIRFMETSLGNDQKPLKIGSVDEPIGSTEEYQENLQQLEGVTRKSQSTEECFNCPIAKGCAWCSGYNYQKFGTVNKRATYICIMHKALSLANVYYWNLYFKKENLPFVMPLNCPEDWALQIISKEEFNFLKEISEKKEGYIDVTII